MLLQIATHPEILTAILSVEALEDNEVLIVEGARHVSRINDPKHKAIYESIPEPIPVTIIFQIHIYFLSNRIFNEENSESIWPGLIFRR